MHNPIWNMQSKANVHHLFNHCCPLQAKQAKQAKPLNIEGVHLNLTQLAAYSPISLRFRTPILLRYSKGFHYTSLSFLSADVIRRFFRSTGVKGEWLHSVRKLNRTLSLGAGFCVGTCLRLCLFLWASEPVCLNGGLQT